VGTTKGTATMKRPRPATAAKVHRCHRCGRRLRRIAYMEAMARGNIQNLTCSTCLTPAEFAEMNVNEATMETALLPDGTILERPKVRP
jgi:transcription elongation factor Elf1